MLPELRPELLPEDDEDVGHAYLECKTVAWKTVRGGSD